MSWFDYREWIDKTGKIPSSLTGCSRTDCVYNEHGWCDDPDCNSGNSDARCFGDTVEVTRTFLGIKE